MAWGAVLGSLIGAGGQIGASYAGQADSSSGSQESSNWNPWGVPTFAASQNDAANLLGYGDVNNTASPIDQIINKIMNAPGDSKGKRRALGAIQSLREAGATSLSNDAFLRHPGRRRKGELVRDNDGKVLRNPDGTKMRATGALNEGRRTVPHTKELIGMLRRLGLTEAEFFSTLDRDIKFKAERDEVAKLQDGFQRDTIENRFKTATTANQLLADAAGYASTGQTQNDAQAGLLGRINRGIDDQEEQYMLRSNFGGFNPGSGADYFNRQRTDAPQTAFEQALAQAAGLTAGLGGGLDFSQRAADSATGAFNSSSSIAAQQAMAANGLRTQANLNNADNMATGISSGSASLGTGISNAFAAGGSTPTRTQPQSTNAAQNTFVQPSGSPTFNFGPWGQ